MIGAEDEYVPESESIPFDSATVGNVLDDDAIQDAPVQADFGMADDAAESAAEAVRDDGMVEGGAPKKRRGPKPGSRRKRKAVPEEVDTEKATAALVASLGASFRFAGSIMARFRGSHWNISEADANGLAGAWAPVVLPYMDTIAESLPWVIAAVATFDVVGGRLEIDRRIAEARKLGRSEDAPHAVVSEVPAPLTQDQMDDMAKGMSLS